MRRRVHELFRPSPYHRARRIHGTRRRQRPERGRFQRAPVRSPSNVEYVNAEMGLYSKYRFSGSIFQVLFRLPQVGKRSFKYSAPRSRPPGRLSDQIGVGRHGRVVRSGLLGRNRGSFDFWVLLVGVSPTLNNLAHIIRSRPCFRDQRLARACPHTS